GAAVAHIPETGGGPPLVVIMPSGDRERSTRPAPQRPSWYRRLPPGLRRIAAQSDGVSAIRFDADLALRGAVAALRDVLKTGRPFDVEAISQRTADGSCRGLVVPTPIVRVADRRPALRGGELHGLYTPGNGR